MIHLVEKFKVVLHFISIVYKHSAAQPCINCTTTLSFLGENPNYILKLSQKFIFEPSITKPDNINHPTIETGQI